MSQDIDLEELKTAWTSLQRTLDANLRLNQRLLTRAAFDRVRSTLGRMIVGLVLEASAWFLFAGLLGNFVYHTAAHPRFWIPALVLDLYVIANLTIAVRQAIAASAIDYERPIAAIQHQLLALRLLRLRDLRWSFLGGILLWTPLVVVILKAFLDVDAFALAPAWLAANAAFSVLFVGLGWILARALAPRFDGHPGLRRLLDDLAGSSLKSAVRQVEELRDFEAEPDVGPSSP